MWDKWTKDGALSVRQVARARAKTILEEHQPEPLSADIEKRVREVITEIEKKHIKG